MSKEIHGLIAAPFTPLNQNGEVVLEAIKPYYEFLKRNNVTGAFICGSTGEGVSLTYDEKIAILKAWTALTKGDAEFSLMMFLGGTNIKECKELAAIAEQEGVDAISFTSPYYFKPADASQLARCCAEVASAAPNTSFYYYHIPVLTGGNYAMLDLLKQVDGLVPTFEGIKYTHEDFMDFLSCMNYKNGKYNMLWGRDENMLSALALGCKGAVGSTYNYASPLYHQLIDAFDNNELVKANKLQQKSIDMITLLGKYGGIATGKAYMKLVGIDCGEFRLPVKNMTAKQFEDFKADVKELGFDEFKSV